MPLTPAQSCLASILGTPQRKTYQALLEAFRDAEAIPGCDASTRALFVALYAGGPGDFAALDQRTGYQYHEAIEKLAAEPTPEPAEALAEVVRERDRQHLIAALGKGISDLAGGAAPQGVSDEIGVALKTVRAASAAPSLDEYVTESIDGLRSLAFRGVELTTGLLALDSLFQFRRSNLCTVGARTSHGKTAFATRVSVRALKAGLSVAYLCFEDYGTWLMKFASQFTQTPLECFTKYHMVSPDDRRKAEKALELCRQFTGLTVLPGMRISEFAAHIERLDAKPDLLVFDYVQKHVEMYGGDMKKNEAAAKATSDFQELARRLGAFGLMTSQLSRGAQENRQKKPSLDGLKESGDLENYSDAVLLLYYPWRDTLDADSMRKEDYKIIVAKNKLGESGEVDLRWHGATLTLEDKHAGF